MAQCRLRYPLIPRFHPISSCSSRAISTNARCLLGMWLISGVIGVSGCASHCSMHLTNSCWTQQFDMVSIFLFIGRTSSYRLLLAHQAEPTIAVKCSGNMPDLAKFLDMDSHRPESAALFAALCFTRKLLHQFPRPPLTGILPNLRIYLDNKSVADNNLEWTFDDTNTPVFDFLKANYDILQGILQVINELPLPMMVHWVKGHQDHQKPCNELPISALANCITDDICTETHHKCPGNVGHFPDWITGTKAALLHNGRLVSKNQDEYVKTAATAPHLCKHIMEDSKKRDKFIPTDWTDDTFDDIDWKAVKSSMQAVSIRWRFQIAKYAHEWTPTPSPRQDQQQCRSTMICKPTLAKLCQRGHWSHAPLYKCMTYCRPC